jgi:hypothetical protein
MKNYRGFLTAFIWISMLVVTSIPSNVKAAGSEQFLPSITSPGRSRDFLGMNLPMLGNKWPHKRGSLWINLSAAKKYIIFPEFGSQKGLLPMQISGDYSFDNHWALGAYYGFFNATYTDSYGSEAYESHIKSNFGGIRLTFHFADVFNNTFGEVINVKKWDFYSTASLGWYSFRWNVASKYTQKQDFSDGSFGSASLILGAKWIPHPKIGIFVEAGKGTVGIISFGVSGKIMK